MIDVTNKSPFMIEKPDLNSVRIGLREQYANLDLTAHELVERKASKVAIVNTANRPWAVLESSFLIECLPDMSVQEFYYSAVGRNFSPTDSQLDREVVSCSELSQLLDSLRLYCPSSIYLRVSPHTKSEFLISVIRIVFPDVSLLVEPYDMTCLFSPHLLGYADKTDSSYLNAMTGCAVALYYADAVVVKMGGERFEQWEKPFPNVMHAVFPSSSYLPGNIEHEKTASNREDVDRKLVLYAGSTSARELNGGIGSLDGANIIRYFDAIVEKDDYHLTIVNGAHSHPEEDGSQKFHPLLKRYAFPGENGHNCSYYRALSQEQINSLAINFDLGICCAHYADDCVAEVTRISVPNRMTSYVHAGLPVIIDDRFEFAASLIDEFNAGAVIPAGDFEAFTHSLANIDIKQAKTGVMHLKRYFQDHNNKKLASLLLAFR